MPNAGCGPDFRDGSLLGYKFRRQMPIGRFVADFACLKAKLVIEVDGGQHAENLAADRARAAAIETAGYTVTQFWNRDVLTDTAGVLDQIAAALVARSETVPDVPPPFTRADSLTGVAAPHPPIKSGAGSSRLSSPSAR